jgi:amidase
MAILDRAAAALGGQFFGTRGNESALLSYAYAFEQAAHARQAPRFLPTLG